MESNEASNSINSEISGAQIERRSGSSNEIEIKVKVAEGDVNKDNYFR